MNEELQSGNEELQTSKEEMQSVNDELQRKIEEVDAANITTNQILHSITDGFAVLDKPVALQLRQSALRRDDAAVAAFFVWHLCWERIFGTNFRNFTGATSRRRFARRWRSSPRCISEYTSPILDRTFHIRGYPSDHSLSIYILDTTERKRAHEMQVAPGGGGRVVR